MYLRKIDIPVSNFAKDLINHYSTYATKHILSQLQEAEHYTCTARDDNMEFSVTRASKTHVVRYVLFALVQRSNCTLFSYFLAFLLRSQQWRRWWQSHKTDAQVWLSHEWVFFAPLQTYSVCSNTSGFCRHRRYGSLCRCTMASREDTSRWQLISTYVIDLLYLGVFVLLIPWLFLHITTAPNAHDDDYDCGGGGADDFDLGVNEGLGDDGKENDPTNFSASQPSRPYHKKGEYSLQTLMNSAKEVAILAIKSGYVPRHFLRLYSFFLSIVNSIFSHLQQERKKVWHIFGFYVRVSAVKRRHRYGEVSDVQHNSQWWRKRKWCMQCCTQQDKRARKATNNKVIDLIAT